MSTRPFKSLEDQIQVLKSRNLTITDEQVAKQKLLENNYYNVVNGYKSMFLRKDNQGNLINPEKFILNSTFDELFDLYEFDKELKNKIFKYILIFEKTLKSYIAYKFSEKFIEEFPYLNINNYSKNKNDIINVMKSMAILSNKVKDKKDENSIEHYLKYHDDLPLWVLINQMTFGETSKFFSALDDSLKDIIASIFSKNYKANYNLTNLNLTATDLQQVIKIAIFFRNICAHDNILFSFKLKKGIKISRISLFLDANVKGINFQGTKLFDLICSLKLVLPKKDFQNLIDDLEKIFVEYENKFRSITFNEIIKLSGFDNRNSHLILK